MKRFFQMQMLNLALLFAALLAPFIWALAGAACYGRASGRQIARVLHAFGGVLAVLSQMFLTRVGAILYANTITNLIPLLYEALDVVSRELVGFIPAVTRDSSAERAALNQTINIPIAPAATTADIAPGTTPPNDGDQTFGNTTMTISKSKYSPVRWNGEEQVAVNLTGRQREVVRDQFSQSMRALCNLVEADLAALAASRAYGTPGTAPFGTAGDLSDIAQIRKVLEDNGAPTTDLHLVLNTAATANLRGKQNVLFKVNESGTDQLLRRGIIGDLEGFALHSSAQVVSTAAGTQTGFTSNTAGYAKGATSIVVAGTVTGSILAGDIITFAGDTNKYVVATGVTAAGQTLVLNSPGLMQALPASAQAITTVGTSARNIALSRNAFALITRAPAMPQGGDMAFDVTEITDPVSGLAFQVAAYKQYRQIRYEIGLAWGTKAVKTDHATFLLG